MKQKTRFVFPLLAATLIAMPALSQNTGRTGGGNRPLATQRAMVQTADKTNASITNTTGSPVTITLDPGDEELQLQSGETRVVSCSQKVWIGKANDASDASAAKAMDLTCQAKYQMRANGGAVEIVLSTMP